MSLKDDKLSFPDQISSRIHRWVQRTTSKVKNDKERSENVRIIRQGNEDIKRDEMDTKKCTLRENFARRSRESRSYEELDRALKDMINNCVTSSSVVTEQKISTPNDNANIHITKESNNNLEFVAATKTNNVIETGFRDQFRSISSGGEFEASFGSENVQEKEKNGSGTSLVSHSGTNLGALPDTESLQNHVGKNYTEGNGKTCLRIDENIEYEVSTVSSQETKQNCDDKGAVNEDFNNFSKQFDSCEINTSSSNVNKGLHSINTGSCLKTLGCQNSDSDLKKKPPLRRIQSEGDALELKLCFKDSDVTEFAVTCIKHAQKKRLSDITPSSYRSVDNPFRLSTPEFVTIEADKDTCFKSLVSDEDVPAPNDKDSTDMLDHAEIIPEIILDKTDGKMIKTEHIPLSARPSSLSFPLEMPKRKSKTSSLKGLRQSPSSPPHLEVSAPQRPAPIPPRSDPSPSLSSPSTSRSTPSPKYRRFPCQPVFYVPKPNEARASPSSSRSGSISEQSKEYLI